ncbi:winged helix-turn-helix transcriptional regulator [bacterium]|nr:winged helix-turn-helix transcriptional regulator [bacterium]
MEQCLTLFKALSDKNRIRIIKILEKRPLCVCEITTILNLACSTTSKHLSVLKKAKLIFEQKEGKWVNYYLNKATMNPYIKEFLPMVKRWLNDDMIIVRDLRKVDKINRNEICKS